MTISELKQIIETAEQLGYGDTRVHLDDSRDGVESYPLASVKLVKAGDQREPYAMLVVGYA